MLRSPWRLTGDDQVERCLWEIQHEPEYPELRGCGDFLDRARRFWPGEIHEAFAYLRTSVWGSLKIGSELYDLSWIYWMVSGACALFQRLF